MSAPSPPPPASGPPPAATRAFWRRPEGALLVLALGTYAYFYQAGGWNQNVRFDLVRAVVEQGRLRINSYHRNTGDKAKRRRHYYSDKAPGVSFLAVPVYAAMHAGRDRETGVFQSLASYACTVWAVALPAALAVAVLYRLLTALAVPSGGAALACVAYAFGTLAFPYATLLYGHQTAAALLLIAFATGRRARQPGANPGWAVGTGALLGSAIAVEYPAALGAAVIGLYALGRRPLRAGWLIVGAAVPLALLGWYHLAAFGGALRLPYQFSTQAHRHQGFFMGLGRPDPAVLYELLFGPFRGLFYTAPWLLLAIPGAVRWMRGRATRAEAVVCLAVPLLYLWLNASLNDWHGGRGFGPRHLVPALPFLTVLAAGLLLPRGEDGRRAPLARVAAVLAVAAVIASVFVMLAGTAVGPEVSARVRRPVEEVLLPSFLEGKLAVSTQGVFMVRAEGDERYAWNLGEKMGLGGLASLIPLALFAAACGAWLATAARARAG